MRSKLLDLRQPLEICDESGRVLANLFPVADLASHEPCVPDFDAEDLDRQEKANEKRYTTAEVLAHLEKL
jgi:hypothetical protein